MTIPFDKNGFNTTQKTIKKKIGKTTKKKQIVISREKPDDSSMFFDSSSDGRSTKTTKKKRKKTTKKTKARNSPENPCRNQPENSCRNPSEKHPILRKKNTKSSWRLRPKLTRKLVLNLTRKPQIAKGLLTIALFYVPNRCAVLRTKPYLVELRWSSEWFLWLKNPDSRKEFGILLTI